MKWKVITGAWTQSRPACSKSSWHHLPRWNAQRRERAAEYSRLLADNDAIVCPYEPSWSRSVYHLYVVRSEDRDEMMEHLQGAGIGTGIHYPIPLHMQKAYSRLHYNPADFPVARRIAAEIVSLPMFPHLTAEQQAQVTDEIFAFTSRLSHKELKSVEISALLPQRIA